MPFDSLVLSAVAAEIRGDLLNDRVAAIHQPEPLTLVLTFGHKRRLLLSAHAEDARVHLIATNRPHPGQPPGFCMLLRKYLDAARLRTVGQPDFDRILELEFGGSEGPVTLIAEMMGRHSNLFLRGSDGTILGSIKPVAAALNRYRETHAGAQYVPPPPGSRVSALVSAPFDAVAQLLQSASDRPLRTVLSGAWTGMSSILVDWLCREAGLDPAAPLLDTNTGALERALARLQEIVQSSSFNPTVAADVEGSAEDVWALPFPYPARKLTSVLSMSSAIDGVYGKRIKARDLETERSRLLGAFKTLIAKERRKIESFRRAAAEGKQADQFRRMAGALLTYKPAIQEGDGQINLPDPNQPDEELSVPVDSGLDAVQNAENLFKRARHAERAAAQVLERAITAEKTLNDLHRISAAVLAAPDLEQIRRHEAEASGAGLLMPHAERGKPAPGKEKQSRKDTNAAIPNGIRRVVAQSGHEIMYGRSSTDNDYLTTRIARPNDWWFHARGESSAHVIIRTNNQPDRVPPATLLEAAQVAAVHSASKHSSYVPVDYTLRKYVVKRRGSAPGMVEYRGEKTLHVQPMLGE